MSARLALRIAGQVRDDGALDVWPRGAYRPVWNGGAQKAPGAVEQWSGDLASGKVRLWQRPYAPYGASHLAPSDVAEVGYPLRQAARPGLFLHGGTIDLMDDTWAITSWTFNDASAVGSIVGPTGLSSGVSQAYKITYTQAAGYALASISGAPNLNANTYVFSVWMRNDAASGEITARLYCGWSSQNTKDWVLDQRWRRCWVTSSNEDSTAIATSIRLATASTGAIRVWAPQLVNSGATAGVTQRGRGIQATSATSAIGSGFYGPVSWPPAPWTMVADWRALYADADGLNHGILDTADDLADRVFALYKASSGGRIDMAVMNHRAVQQDAYTASTLLHEALRRVVLRAGADGSMRGWLNGTAFINPVAGPLARIHRPPATLTVGSVTGLGTADLLLHKMEVWEGEVEAERFL